MEEHPIAVESLMNTAMSSLKDMIDVNTIIGDPIETSNNIIIIPISKVGFGFASGGSEFNSETVNEYTKKDKDEQINYRLPFGGGSGAGVSISPVAFLVIQENNVKLIPVCHNSALDRLLDYVPDIIEKSNSLINKKMNDVREDKKEQERKIERLKKEVRDDINKQRINNYTEKEDVKTEAETQSQQILQQVEPQKVQPRRVNNQRYEFEYDET